jgi:plastocyanin domain-containing protein
VPPTVRRFLPTGQVTPIEFTPDKPGTHEFACGMGMVRGKLTVR